MRAELKAYLAEIGRRGGNASSAKKAAAVRKNGALGGRPRKDGRPPGSKTLEDVLIAVESSTLSKPAERDLRLWTNSNATLFHEGVALLGRDQVAKVEAMIRRSWLPTRRLRNAPLPSVR